ncbi:hypothetical protein [Virgibacillus sp. JSM 102003]|uniref:hypothetical protein n=1 Tax=Virgibacillus sp. JSM 102003 TaxID=1562108 RepID=UPI0035C10081
MITGTGPGRVAKKFVTDGVKKVYDGVAEGAKAVKNSISDGFSKAGDFLWFGR